MQSGFKPIKIRQLGRIGIKKKMFIAAFNPLKLQEVIFGLF
jgi:hypothetical protein